jgi:methionine-rich copper-binding protein CopC
MVKVSLALCALLTMAAATLPHVELKSSIPARNSSGPAPASVSLTFSEDVRVAVSRIAILTADSALVEKVVIREKKDAATFGGPITKPLAPGKYLVSWATMSDDGHAVKGFIPFTVVAAK